MALRVLRPRASVVRETITRFMADDLLLEAAALTYYTHLPAVMKGPESKKQGIDEAVDERLEQTVRPGVQTGQVAISHLQRRLKRAYTQAARLVAMMERDGIVGPVHGAKPREILVKPSCFDGLDRHRQAVDSEAKSRNSVAQIRGLPRGLVTESHLLFPDP